MEDFSKDVESCLEVLQSGGVILYPTDTVWGLGCDATNAAAVEKIIALKNRPANKSFVVLVASEKDILKYAASPDLAVFDYLQTVHKPTTVIYENALGIAENALADDGSVAMRICKDAFCKHLIKRFRKPIISTSANKSGEPTPQNFADITDTVKTQVDYCVQYKQHDKTGTPSAIIRWDKGKAVVIRE
jgi:L-threonylcarbamoyladenylate synthase